MKLSRKIINRRLASVLALVLIVVTVFEYGPILSFAEEEANNNILSEIQAEIEEDSVCLFWEYQQVPVFTYPTDSYEVWLKNAEGEICLEKRTDLQQLCKSTTIENARTTMETYTIEVYRNYSVPKTVTPAPTVPPAESTVTNGDVSGGDVSGSNNVTGGDVSGSDDVLSGDVSGSDDVSNGDVSSGDASGGDVSGDSTWEREERRDLIGSRSFTWFPQYKVEFQIGRGGTVIFEESSYEQGSHAFYIVPQTEISFQIQPDEKYEIEQIHMEPSWNCLGDNRYSLESLTEDVVVRVTFSKELKRPELEEHTPLSVAEDTPLVVGENVQVAFQSQDEDVTIYYQFLQKPDEAVKEDEWKAYIPEETIALQENYQIGVLKAKAVLITDSGRVKESPTATWYYSMLPPLPSNLTFQFTCTGSDGSYHLNRNNWVKASDSAGIQINGLEQDIRSNADTYQYILCLAGEDGVCVEKEFVWSAEAGAYRVELHDGLDDGRYEVGYTVRNALGKQVEIQNTNSVLAYDSSVPQVKWTENSGYLVPREEEKYYFTREELQFEVKVTEPAPLSGIVAYRYKVGDNEWTEVEGKRITIPLKDISDKTKIGFQAETTAGYTGETYLYVTKDVTPPGGMDGSLKGELLTVVEKPALSNKNPADSTCEEEDSGEENNIYYIPEQLEEAVFSKEAAKEADSQSKILVKYKIQEFGTSFSNEGSSKLSAAADGNYHLALAQEEALQNEGKYQLYVWTEDEAGNGSEPIVWTLCYDKTEPKILNTGYASGLAERSYIGEDDTVYQQFAFGSITAVLQISEVNSGLSRIEYYNIAGGERKLLHCEKMGGITMDGSQTVEFSVNQPGTYCLKAKVYDMAGNSSEDAIGEKFLLDDTEPVLQVDGSGIEGNWINRDAVFQIHAFDKESGIQRVEYTVNEITKTVLGNNDGSPLSIQAVVTEEAKDSSGVLLNISAYNRAGAVSRYTGRVLIDRTAPVISVSGIEAGKVYNKQAVLDVSIQEQIYEFAQAHIEVQRKLDGISMPYEAGAFQFVDTESTQNFSFSEDGEYFVTVSAKDAAGNEAIAQSVSFIVDSTAPVIHMSGIQDGYYYKESPSLNLEVIESFYESAEVRVKVTRQLGGDIREYDLPRMDLYARESRTGYNFSEEGTYTVEVSATDAAGNAAEKQTVSFVVDKTAPELSIEGFSNHLITDKNVAVQFIISETYYQGMQVNAKIIKTDLEDKSKETQLAVGPANGNVTRFLKEISEDGKYTISLEAVDKAGNADRIEKSFIIDTQAPDIRYVKEYDGKYFQVFRLSHALEDMIYDFTLHEYEITLNGMFYDGVSEITEDGKYLLEVTARDEVGHETKEKAEFIVDGTAPMIIFGGTEDKKVNYEPVTLMISLRDEPDYFTRMTIDDSIQTITEGSQQTLQFQNFGTFQVKVTAEDLAGNMQTAQITVIYAEETIFSKWYSNKPLFYSTVTGMAVIVAAVGIYMIVVKDKKKNRGIKEKECMIYKS